MFKFFNVFLSSGTSMDNEWSGELNAGIEKTKKKEVLGKIEGRIEKDEIEAAGHAHYDFDQGKAAVGATFGIKKIGGLNFSAKNSPDGWRGSIEPYGPIAKLPRYAATAASLAGGYVAGIGAMNLYTSVNAAPEPYKPLAVGLIVGGLFALGLKLLFNYLGRKK